MPPELPIGGDYYLHYRALPSPELLQSPAEQRLCPSEAAEAKPVPHLGKRLRAGHGDAAPRLGRLRRLGGSLQTTMTDEELGRQWRRA